MKVLRKCALSGAWLADLLGWAGTLHQSGPGAEVWSRGTRGSSAGGLWTPSPGNPSRSPQRCRSSSAGARPAWSGQRSQNQTGRMRLSSGTCSRSSPAVHDGVNNVALVCGVQAALPPSRSSAQVFEVKVRERRKFIGVDFSFQQLVWTVEVHVEEICRIRRDRDKDATLHTAHCSSNKQFKQTGLNAAVGWSLKL